MTRRRTVAAALGDAQGALIRLAGLGEVAVAFRLARHGQVIQRLSLTNVVLPHKLKNLQGLSLLARQVEHDAQQPLVVLVPRVQLAGAGLLAGFASRARARTLNRLAACASVRVICSWPDGNTLWRRRLRYLSHARMGSSGHSSNSHENSRSASCRLIGATPTSRPARKGCIFSAFRSSNPCAVGRAMDFSRRRSKARARARSRYPLSHAPIAR